MYSVVSIIVYFYFKPAWSYQTSECCGGDVDVENTHWPAESRVPNLANYFQHPPESFEPHEGLGGIQCYQRKCRIEAANSGTCPGMYVDRRRGNFCIARFEFGYLVFDGAFSVFDLTGACYDRVKACHTSYCNTNDFYLSKEGWCDCGDRQCILKMTLNPPNFITSSNGSELQQFTEL